MTPAQRWRAYALLAILSAAAAVPFRWALGSIALAGVARVALAAGRRVAAGRARRAGAAARGGLVSFGRDLRGRVVTLSDQQLAAHALIVGASGAGKSTTMTAILAAHIRDGRPVVAIDMKGSPGFAGQLSAAATAAGRQLRVWTPDGPNQWNPLAHGNPTALKDMLISTERFSEPHYQRAAERYLQTALTVLHALGPQRAPLLHEVVAVMDPRRLGARLRELPPELAERVGDYLSGLTPDQENAARGLGTRLAVLSESTAGRYLAPGPHSGGQTVDLGAALAGGDVVLMSLNSSVYGQLAAQLGALAIQNLTSAAGSRLQSDGGWARPATVAIDEFSALGADNVLALLARGRESGITMLVGTQELSDLERAGRGFRDQVMGIVGVTVAHRQEVHDSAVMVSQMAGTQVVWDTTQTLRGLFARPGANRGTRRQVERPVIHPNVIKLLGVGEAVLISKLPSAQVGQVRVSPPALGDPGRRLALPRAGRAEPSLGAPTPAEPSVGAPTPAAATRLTEPRVPLRRLPGRAAPERPGTQRPAPERPGTQRPATDGPAPEPPGTRRPSSAGRRDPPDQPAPGVTR